MIDQLTSLPVTVNFHRWCLTKENFTRWQLHLKSPYHDASSGTKWATSGSSSQWTRTLREWSLSPPWRLKISHSMQPRSINFQHINVSVHPHSIKWFSHYYVDTDTYSNIPSSTLRRICLNGLPNTQAFLTPGSQYDDHQKHQQNPPWTPSNVGKQLACLSTWWSTLLRQPGAVPINFLQGGEWWRQ